MKRKLAIFLYLLVASLFIIYGLANIELRVPSLSQLLPTPTAKPIPPVSDAVRVAEVVDGDTIILDGGKKLRYIGIDTPETVDPRRPVGCFGKEAAAMNKKLVAGRYVRLEKDISDTDKYNRLLRYVWTYPANGSTGSALFVNEYLVREGYARASTYPPDVKYAERFRELQEEARITGKGLWGACK